MERRGEIGYDLERWNVCCQPKSLGGLGLCDLACFNQALLAKLAWRILKEPDSLIASVLLGKYCQRSDFLDNPSELFGSMGLE